MRVKRLWIYILIVSLFTCHPPDERFQVDSPDGRIQLIFDLIDGQPSYSVMKDGKPILLSSALGIEFENTESLKNLKVVSVKSGTFSETWEQPWGQKRFIENKYDELRVNLRETNNQSRRISLVFRAFNDGIGFRYAIPRQAAIDSFKIKDEITEFRLAHKAKAWWIPAYKERFYESLYRSTSMDEMDTVCTPLTLKLNNECYLAIHEANLTEYGAMNLFCKEGTTLSCDITPWSTGEKVRARTPFVSPWRVIILADSPGELLTSNLILNLNEPSRIEDTSWIIPGKYIGIWWGIHQEKYTWAQGPKHGASTKNVLKYIDFAADNGFEGVLVEGWNYGWDEDWTDEGHHFSYTKSYPDFDLNKITDYAASRGVTLIGHHETGGNTINYEEQMEAAFRLYSEHGVRIVKTGYVSDLLDGKESHSSQYGVRHFRKVIETAARYKIMINNHEPVMPTGLQRTYPNLMTQEGVRGQEWDAWSADGGNPPDHTTIVPFTRGLAGPMDFTFGTFNFNNPVLPETRVQTTLAKQIALYVVIYSPLQMASDLPENYVQNKAFNFIKQVPVNWSETKVLDAVIGDYVIIARKDRNSEDWYCGAITDEEGRTLSIGLEFLDPESEYRTEIICDAPSSDWKTNPEIFNYREVRLSSEDSLKLILAPGGGQALRFSPVPK